MGINNAIHQFLSSKESPQSWRAPSAFSIKLLSLIFVEKVVLSRSDLTLGFGKPTRTSKSLCHLDIMIFKSSEFPSSEVKGL